MKKTFVKKHFQKLLLEKEANRVVSNHKIKTIGIISTDEISKWIDVKKDVNSAFEIENTKIYSYRTYSKKNKKSIEHFSEKGFGWKGQVKDPNLKAFLNEPFDLLIGYFNKNHLYTELAVLHSKAKFKAGISKVNQQLYDIEIAEFPKNTARFLQELKRYLQILNKL